MSIDKNTLKEEVIVALVSAGAPRTRDQLAAMLHMDQNDAALSAAIGELNEAALIALDAKQRIGLPHQMGMARGVMSRTASGFGFVSDKEFMDADVFIPPPYMNGAMRDDTVLVEVTSKTGSRGRGPEGRVLRVVKRAHPFIVGVLEEGPRGQTVRPDDPKICDGIHVLPGGPVRAQKDERVVVTITSFLPLQGYLTESLGKVGEPGSDILAILRQYGLKQEFPDKVEKEARAIAETGIGEKDLKDREDLRGMFMVTIDGADAKDLDDAVSCEKLSEHLMRLGVHIADVSHYVQAGTALDEEAQRRGTSVYFPDRVVPMLPEALSNDICSLNQGVDRLAMSVFMDINPDGRMVDYRICQSVIKTNFRLVYDDVTRYVEHGDPEIAGRFGRELCAKLDDMKQLMQWLRGRRMKRGSIDFELSESQITLDDRGRPIEVKRRESGVANQIIEEFMLRANETVAEHCRTLDIPCLYRVHEQPDPMKMNTFAQFIGLFGYKLPGRTGGVHPSALQQLLGRIRNTPEETVITRLMLRSMQKARYLPVNLGHFGLALTDYAHFTSPIRRYPDLIVHRVLHFHLAGLLDQSLITMLEDELDEVADSASASERNAIDAERDADALKKCEYMADHLGEPYEGMVSGVTEYGFYVELDNTVEGLVHVQTMSDDIYDYDRVRQQLIGHRSRRSFRIGDTVLVQAIRTNPVNRTIDFELVKEENSAS
ncbi:MAG: ribonuclease R [Christensenellales bacterium]|jgi:ribonuclease R